MTVVDTVDVAYSQQNLRVELLLRQAKSNLKAPHTLSREQWPPNYDEVLVWRRSQLARYETDPVYIQNAKSFYANNAVAFINHWCDTYDPRNDGIKKPKWMPFILFQRQEELVQFALECLAEQQPGLIEKCRTMGATWVFVALSVWIWLFHDEVATGWGSQKSDSVSVIGDPSSIFEKIRMLIRRIPSCFKPASMTDELKPDRHNLKAMEIINPENQSTIIGQVGDNIGRGARTTWFFEDEAAHYEHPDLIEAAISETTRVPIMLSSVNGIGNLFHRKREAGLDWYPGAKLEKGYTRVFVMDYSDHPEYNKAWYEEKKAFHERQGTPHVFAQEIDRNYAASVTGAIIPKDWLDACVDAHIVLGIPISENKISGLDIGDSQDGDRNAQATRHGIVLNQADEWYARDPGVTARKAMGNCIEQKCRELQYDAAGGLGSTVKSEVNRLKDEGVLPDNDPNALSLGIEPKLDLICVPWNAGGKVLHPSDRVVPLDKQSPFNKNYFANLKAQGWWHCRTIVYNTWNAIEKKGKYDPETGMVVLPDGTEYDPDELISLSSKLPLLKKVMKELCQATIGQGAKLKLVVDKSPEGTKSPNIADAIIMIYWPMPKNMGDFADIGMGGKVFVNGLQLS